MGQFSVSTRCTIHLPELIATQIFDHLFPGDGLEHELVLLAGVAQIGSELRLLVREIVLPIEGRDCGVGKYGHRSIKAQFIQPLIRRARAEQKVFLSVHNHSGDDFVAFSGDDLRSHERGYPALLDLVDGMPVGAAVVARRALAGDIWMPDGRRLEIQETRVIGSNLKKLYPSPKMSPSCVDPSEFHHRQALIFGARGQDELRRARVGVIGVGGVGSLVVEYLARLGVGTLTIVDPDRIAPSNLSRVVGATRWDTRYPFSSSKAPKWARSIASRYAARKVDIAKRVARLANPDCLVNAICADFAKDSIAKKLVDHDFLILAADSMRARLVFNAIVQQYFVPGFQIGTRIEMDEESNIVLSAFSVLRWVLPGQNCLWCSGMISTSQLAIEAKTQDEARDQAYGTSIANPSVITMNAVAAAHAANDFLFSYLSMFKSSVQADPLRWKHLLREAVVETYPASKACSECSAEVTARYGQGDHVDLPSIY